MEPPAKTLPEIKNTSVVGTVASIPRVDEERTRFVLTTDQGNRYHRQYQVVCQFSLPIKKGDKLWLTGSLEPPHQGGNPGEFDYRKYLYHQGAVSYTHLAAGRENQRQDGGIDPARAGGH